MSQPDGKDKDKPNVEIEDETEPDVDLQADQTSSLKSDSTYKNLNLSSLFEYLRKLNEYLDQEEEYDRQARKIRRVIYKHDLISKKILFIFKYLLNRINLEAQKDIFLVNPSRLLQNNKELISNLKLIKSLNEVLKLLVDLTSPHDCLFINHNLIFIILNRFELIVKHNLVQIETPDFLNEINQQLPFDENLPELIESNIQKFKDDLIKMDLFTDIGISLTNLVDFYTSMSSIFHQNRHQSANSFLKHFKLLTNILFDSLVLNLALIRNLTFERNDSKLTMIINRLFVAKIDNFLLSMANLSKLNKSLVDNKKYEQRAFVSHSLLIQIFSLTFSKLSSPSTQSTTFFRAESPLSSVSSSQVNLNDLKAQSKMCKSQLNRLARGLCKTGSFACLVEQFLRLITKPVDLYVYFDVAYFLWFLKFTISNYVLKQLKEHKNDAQKPTTTLNSSNTGLNIEKSFLNDSMSEASQRTKKTLLNYDLLSYVVFLILENFEHLIFDSNLKNMNLLRLFRVKQFCAEHEQSNSKSIGIVEAPRSTPPVKMVNTNNLRILSLSLNCLHELLDCINHHLEYLNSFKLNTLGVHPVIPIDSSECLGSQEDYLIFLNEYINFDDLKQLFSLLMRFYCYNQHVYSNSLIKSIFLTNQLFLNTFKHVHDLIRQLKLREQDKDMFELNSDTNATKNSSTVSNITVTVRQLNLNELYNMYANTDTSFILKHVLTQFVHNDPLLNRCVIDLLDSLMCESDKHEYLFHMNFALALANIATLENYRMLDQRTKDLVSNMLCGIRRLCKRRPNFANKILFDVNYNSGKGNGNANEDDYTKTNSRKRIKLDTSESDPFFDSDSFESKYSTTRSSWSSLKSSVSVSPSSSSPGSSQLRGNNPENGKCSKEDENEANLSSGHKHENEVTELSKELKLIVENEFLFCLRSLDVFNKTNYIRKLDPTKMCNYIIKNDHLYRIFNYLVDFFDSSASSNDLKINSWQIYNCLLNMKFSMSEKIDYLNELNNCYLTGSKFSLGINLGFGSFKNDFFKSTECISLRQACSTDEFRKQLREAYIKYLIEKLCVKSKRTKNAILWVFTVLKKIKLYLIKRSIYMNKNTNDLNQFNLASHQFATSANSAGPGTSSGSPLFLMTTSSSVFQMKLLSYYHGYSLGIPLIPYTFELQQVFHSVDFSNLLDILGLVRTNRGFPFIPADWLDSNKNKLNECLSVMEKCLCI